jgi:heme-degrading monooxygenase HmoA
MSKPPKDGGLASKVMAGVLGVKDALDRPFRPATAGQIVSEIRFRVFEGKEDMLPKIWGGQRNMLEGVEGALGAELRKGPGEREFLIVTRWENLEALEAWKEAAREKGGKHMARMLRGESRMVEPPYEVTRWEVLVSSG